MQIMQIYPPDISQELIDQQWMSICCQLKNAIDKYKSDYSHSYVVIPYKIFDANRKLLEKNGFWTTNHVVLDNCYIHVTSVSWA